MLRRIIKTLTGGRPMVRVGPAFVDRVTGIPVHYWMDCWGRYWLAEARWSWYRLPVNRPWIIFGDDGLPKPHNGGQDE